MRARVALLKHIQAKERETGKRLMNQEIAAMARVHKTNITPYINGTIKRPSLDVLGNLAAWFGCKPGDLLDWTDGAERGATNAK